MTTSLFLLFVLLFSRMFWIHTEQPFKLKRLILIALMPLFALLAFSFRPEVLIIVLAISSPPFLDALLNRKARRNGPSKVRLLLLFFGSVLILWGTIGEVFFEEPLLSPNLTIVSALHAYLGAFPWQKLFLILNAILLSTSEYNLIIRLVLSKLGAEPKLEKDGSRDQKEFKAGRIIGALERMLILILFMGGNTGAVGLVITAKGLIRFPELKDRDFAEYFLVGTLLSVIGALAVSAILKMLI